MEENLKQSQTGRYYPIDNETCNILIKNNIKEFLDWSNLLVNKSDREQICKYISCYIHDIKKLNKLGVK